METPTVINPARLAKLEAKAPRIFPPLEQVTKPNLTTAELAYYSDLKEQTWRVKACYDTAPEGLRPRRIFGKLAWSTAGAKRLLLGLQAGFADALILVAIAALAMLVQTFAPGLIDLTSFAMLGAGVIGHNNAGRRYFPLSQLAAAAQANGCTVHMHHDEDLGYPIYSVGNSNIGAREFDNFDAALKFAGSGKFTESDCAAQAGAAIADNCLNGMLDLDNQTDRANLLAAALVDLATLKHHEHAAAGFAGALVAVIERGLKRIGNASQLDNIFMQNEVGVMMAERESQIDSDAMLDDTGRMLSEFMVRQKRIRYARNENTCPICGGGTVFLNVGSDHYETCPDCKKSLHYGENLHSGWRNETPEIWAANQKILDGYTEFETPPAPPPLSAAELDDHPF